MNNERCGICNKVSSRDIQTNIGDFSKDAFVADPKSPEHHICMECKEVVEELSLEYVLGDDPYGWDMNQAANDNEED